MTQVTGYILRLSSDREQLLKETEEDYFAEPVREFQHSRNVPLICFVVANSGLINWIAKANRGFLAGTGLRRLNLEDFHEVEQQIYVDDLMENCAPRFRAKLEDRFTYGGILPPKTFQELLNALSAVAPQIASILSAYSESRQKRIKRLSEKTRKILAEQKEAVATALSIMGMDRKALLNWEVTDESLPTSFLDGLSQSRLREKTPW